MTVCVAGICAQESIVRHDGFDQRFLGQDRASELHDETERTHLSKGATDGAPTSNCR